MVKFGGQTRTTYMTDQVVKMQLSKRFKMHKLLITFNNGEKLIIKSKDLKSILSTYQKIESKSIKIINKKTLNSNT